MNNKGLSYELGVTMFSDLTDEEFVKIYATKMQSSEEMNVYMHGFSERRSLKFLDNSNDPRFKKEFERMKYKDGKG